MIALPYFSSLNSKMSEYYKQVKMQEYNDTYQQAQLDIVLDGQRNLASQAQIMEKLNELQREIANQTVQSIIPLSKTNVSEKKAFEKPTIKTNITPKAKSPLLEGIQNIKLKKTPSPEAKVKKQSPFEKELEEEIKSRESSPKKISPKKISPKTVSEPKLTKKQKEEILKQMRNPELYVEKRGRGRPAGSTNKPKE